MLDNKIYVVKRNKIVEALDDVQAFIEKIKLINDKVETKVGYNITIKEQDNNENKWEINLELKRN